MSAADISTQPPIEAHFMKGAAPSTAHLLFTTYYGTREQLVNAGLATRSMFPVKANRRESSGRSHPESGEWALWVADQTTDSWGLQYWTPIWEVTGR